MNVWCLALWFLISKPKHQTFDPEIRNRKPSDGKFISQKWVNSKQTGIRFRNCLAKPFTYGSSLISGSGDCFLQLGGFLGKNSTNVQNICGIGPQLNKIRTNRYYNFRSKLQFKLFYCQRTSFGWEITLFYYSRWLLRAPTLRNVKNCIKWDQKVQIW